ncbi:succinylglutamate desuccinylase [Kineobactrum sediminis]|uniref:Succinylglutamate desuccinylase n=1 Tax=Kineobactrum sediminis TaxID=1905677 RepID=A0A2N5XZK9_9GAMM|nr:succinylglutamate desuccinylase/aspartoacylase family protein [Kineobactrum sediminis]PLW81578.1 succinylglutamate desuccinylase [Kineobactrum sediminis]
MTIRPSGLARKASQLLLAGAISATAVPGNAAAITDTNTAVVAGDSVATTSEVLPEAEPEQEIPEEAIDVTPHLDLLKTRVPPNTYTRLAWAPTQSFEGIYIATPVLVANGADPGPTLCITAALHGDELNGIETVRRVLYNLDPAKLKGTVIGVPIVNLQGFHSSSRYLADRRDLNRYFPGDPGGSSASRLAYSFFNEIIQHCSAVVDLHTGSFNRTNLPQLRGDLSNPGVVQLTKGFGSTVVLHSDGSKGTLRRAAVEFGIPAVTLEAGGPSVLDEDSVEHSVKGIRTLLNHLGMTARFSLWGDPEPVYYNSVWQRAPVGGIVFSRVALGQSVKKGEVLATINNPITNVRTRIVSSYDGRIIGMALNQVVQPGFATHHIGIAPPKDQISDPEPVVTLEGRPEPGDADEEMAEISEDEDEARGED